MKGMGLALLDSIRTTTAQLYMKYSFPSTWPETSTTTQTTHCRPTVRQSNQNSDTASHTYFDCAKGAFAKTKYDKEW